MQACKGAICYSQNILQALGFLALLILVTQVKWARAQ